MPDAPVNLSTRILKEIRDEVRRTNERLDTTNERLDAVAERITESELRTATALTDLATTVRDLTALLRTQSDLRPRVERCERDIAELRQRIG